MTARKFNLNDGLLVIEETKISSISSAVLKKIQDIRIKKWNNVCVRLFLSGNVLRCDWNSFQAKLREWLPFAQELEVRILFSKIETDIALPMIAAETTC